MIECYYVNCPTLYVPVRGGRVRRWLNLRKLGGVGFAPYHECGWIEDLGLGCEDLGLGLAQLRGRLYRRNRGWFSVAVRRYRSIALVLVLASEYFPCYSPPCYVYLQPAAPCGGAVRPLQ